MTHDELLEATINAYDDVNGLLLRADHEAAVRAALSVALEAAAQVARSHAAAQALLDMGVAKEIGTSAKVADAIAAAIRALKPKE